MSKTETKSTVLLQHHLKVLKLRKHSLTEMASTCELRVTDQSTTTRIGPELIRPPCRHVGAMVSQIANTFREYVELNAGRVTVRTSHSHQTPRSPRWLTGGPLRFGDS